MTSVVPKVLQKQRRALAPADILTGPPALTEFFRNLPDRRRQFTRLRPYLATRTRENGVRAALAVYRSEILPIIPRHGNCVGKQVCQSGVDVGRAPDGGGHRSEPGIPRSALSQRCGGRVLGRSGLACRGHWFGFVGRATNELTCGFLLNDSP